MMEYLFGAMVVLMALQLGVFVYLIYREERRAWRRDPVIEAMYRDAMKTLAEYGKTLQR